MNSTEFRRVITNLIGFKYVLTDKDLEQIHRINLEEWEKEERKGIKPLAGIDQKANFCSVHLC